MKTKLPLIFTLTILLSIGNSTTVFSQNTSNSKRLEVFNQKKKQKTKQAISQAAKVATVVHPGKSANYSWDNMSSQWVFNDTSVYAYNPQSWLISETRRLNTPISRVVNTYDTKARIIEELNQNYNSVSNLWENSSRSVFVYDANDNLTELRYETYTTQWDILFGDKNQYTYDMQGRMTENVYSSWDSNTNQWEINGRETAFVYNGNNLTQYDSQIWNGSSYDNDSRTVLVYTAPSSIPVEAEFKIWSGSNFESDFRYINLTFQNWCGMFCDETTLKSGTVQVWGNPVANQWNTEARINTTYDVFGGFEEITENYVNSAWVNDYRYSEFFDTKYNYTGSKGETWDTVNVAWETDYEEKEIHTYNPSNQITQTIWQYWDWMNSQLENSMKKEYFDFQTFTAVNELKNDIRLSIYPNPCMGECFIEYTNAGNMEASDLTLRLMDVHGKEVYSTPLKESRIKIETNTLPSGVYFYQLNSASQSLKTGKLIVE
jgi:hypothetical protein